MLKHLMAVAICGTAFAMSATAQTVTSSGTTGTVNNVPYISAATSTSTTLGVSPISVSGGNVGIGTTTPGALLNIYAATGNGGEVGITSGVTPSSSFIGVTSGGSLQIGQNVNTNSIVQNASYQQWRARFGSSDSFDIERSPAGSTYTPTVFFYVNNSGNIGIGTATPGSLLDINGAATATSSTNYSSGALRLTGDYYNSSALSSPDFWNVRNVIGSGTTPTSTLTFTHNGSTGVATVSMPALTISGSETISGGLTVSGTATAATFTGSGSGLTGIPYSAITGVPAAGVSSVFGRTGAITAAAGDYTVNQITGAAPLASPAFSGNVGIGTSAPASLLDIFGSASFGVPNFGGNYLGTVGKFQILTGGTSPISDRLVFGTDNSGWKMAFSKNASGTVTDLMTIQDNGNIGIGTTSPFTTLHINSNGAALAGYGLMLGQTYNSGNSAVALNAETARFEISFPTYRDVEPNQIGAKISAIRWNNWIANSALVQAVDLAFFTSVGSDGGNTTSLVDTSSEKMRITAAGNVGIGTTSPGAKLEVDGNLKLTSGSGATMTYQDGSVQTTAWTGVLCGGDYAESVDVTGDRTHYEPGDVLVLDADNPGKMLKSIDAYSTSVSGIYSTKPGTLGRRQITPKSPDEVPMAVVGIVPAKVSAENGPIKVGDLLVSSSTPGYAMKGTDRSRMLGAVVGKAMGALDSGTGVIEVLVTLQ
jgi:hypothetical protein